MIFDLAVAEKNVDKTIQIMQEMLKSVDEISKFTKAELYQHMKFKETRKEFLDEMKKNLIESFKDEETYGYLKDDNRWQALTV